MKKIIITGGHFTPGLAIIPVLRKKGFLPFWVGEENAVLGTKIKTLEARILPGLDVPYYAITTAKFSRDNLFLFILNLWKLPVGFIQSFLILVKVKPRAVLSFGGYVSYPVCFTAWLLGIPIIVHEQTAASGLANRQVAKIARFVAISFENSRKAFTKEKTVLTGNLVRESIFEIPKKRSKRKKNRIPVIYITGGSRGSQAINKAVFEIAEELAQGFVVYHQTGSLDLETANKISQKIKNGNYRTQDVIAPTEVERRLEEADLVIARSGANTVSEIAICQIPAIFIPLPFAGSDEQTKNAELLEEAGMAQILPQGRLSGTVLLEMINKVYGQIDNYRKNASRVSALIPQDASFKLVSLIEKAI